MTEIRMQVRFSQVPHWVSDHEQSGLSHKAVRLYTLLMRYADSEGAAFPSRRTLARKMGLLARDGVDSAVRELIRAGALEVSSGAGNGGVNVYTLIQMPPEGCRENSVGGAEKTRQRTRPTEQDPEVQGLKTPELEGDRP